jgi:hypothetical protein
MPEVKKEAEQNNAIMDRQNLTEGIVRQLIDSKEEVQEVLMQISDPQPVYEETKNEEGIIISKKLIGHRLGDKALVNEDGLKRISTLLKGISNKDIGIGFRDEKTIISNIRNTMEGFIWDLKHNFNNWGIKFQDCKIMITLVEYFLIGVLSKSYKGHGLKSISGTVQSKETVETKDKAKGIGGLFGGGVKE